jgi:hypothetical protein
MIKVLGQLYYLDFEKIDSLITIISTGDTEPNVSIVKFELVKTMIDVIMSESEDVDDMMGLKGSNSLSIPFKIAYNTLLRYEILKEL